MCHRSGIVKNEFVNTFTPLRTLLNCFHDLDFEGTGYVPESCKDHIGWSFKTGKFSAAASRYYKNMEKITGVEYRSASFEDFQRYFKCMDRRNEDCNSKGLQFPLKCTYPPCNMCTKNQPGK